MDDRSYGALRSSCLGILWHLQREADRERRRLIFADFLTKCRELPKHSQDHWEIIGYRIYNNEPGRGLDLLPTLGDDMTIGLVVVKPREMAAVSFALGLDVELPHHEERGRYAWHVGQEGFSYVVTQVGEEGSFRITESVKWLQEYAALDAMVLVGCGAGEPDLVSRGQVVLSERVACYEGAVVTVEGIHRRPDFVELDEEMARRLAYYELLRGRSFSEEGLGVARLRGAGLFRSDLPDDYREGVKGGTILSGEKMFQDGISIRELRLAFDERTRSVDQESWAFAKSCDDEKMKWLVARGIADYGMPYRRRPEKGSGERYDDRSFQLVATLNAMDVCSDFIARVLVPARVRQR